MLKRKENLAFKKIGDTTFILELGKKRLFHELNDMASFIWEQLDGTKSEEDIIASVIQSYEVHEEEVRADFKEFVDLLKSNDLLT